ncbi:hypothetical protein QMG90_21410 [Trabulsiella odontotermitis]|uniref:hypothetical protein n=1 Tax=Trabulsiella odontotermitis TaxID=379893 RepID=UPI0024B8369E|nr:hypothetical protein [Trabulsiella odontotermitis]WHP31246.1 hypothetical protein QMG90_21410 [Trabulsiella odontotermitis]
MHDIQKEHLSPFLSILVGVNIGRDTIKPLHEKIMLLIDTKINKPGTINLYPTSFESIENAEVAITPYSFKKKPSWTIRNNIHDEENHIALTFLSGKHMAFYFSETGMKDSVREYFKSSSLLGIHPVDISYLNYLFINEDNIKMLWLLGIHGKNNVKADSKVLGGNSVADSLDPLEDQSYMMSAVRTEIGNKNKTIGLNPFKSSIWRGPCQDWNAFENNVSEILDTLNSNSKSNHNPIGILANPINDLSNVKDAYDFTILDPELIPFEVSPHKLDLLRILKNKYTTEISYYYNTSFTLKVYFEETLCGDITVKLIMKDYEISFDIISKNYTGKNRKILDTFSKIFKHPDFIKCWYESGHAVVNSWVFQNDYKDVFYNDFIWADFENYNICKEKPLVSEKLDLQKIGLQDSLFCWVKNRWNSRWLVGEKFNTTETPQGWLYCDDGAGEKADFIHIDDFENQTIISLIHVKAANSSNLTRRISVGAHEIVLSQAIKNLRYANRKNLLQDLTERATNAKNKMCWHNNKLINYNDFLGKLSRIKTNPNSIKTRVIIIQPHTIKSYYNNLNNNSNIKKQLDVLLVSTDNAIKSSGAEFHIIGFSDS